jgi:hypothetical protein
MDGVPLQKIVRVRKELIMRNRDWKKFENDEIMTIWAGYKAQEFGTNDPCRLRLYHDRPIRLTPMEIVMLVDNLMERLDIKENGVKEEY